LYRTYRDAEGKVCREYLGTGRKAELIFVEDQLRRAEEASRKKQCQERLERIANVEQECGPFIRWADLLARAAFLSSGFHQHNRGHWRAKRDQSKQRKAQRQTPNAT
jgi:hypothetical protein